MRIEVRVSTNCKDTQVVSLNGIYKVKLKSKPLDNRANLELIDTLSKYFNVSKLSVTILKGLKSSNKLVEISENED
ncbi:MAG: DUF167 domain-containing protein [Candidatus Dojkabacteria bacterium]|nr:DUF167 domain-containing protein [Candidatus Dojkabacteria bacterium]